MSAESPPAERRLPATTLTHRVQYAALRIVVGGLTLLPWRAVCALGAAIGRIGYWPLRIRRFVVDTQIADSFPDLDVSARRRIARGAYAHLGRITVESGVASERPKEFLLDLFHPPVGWEHIERATSTGQGVILVSGHLGNWELGASYVAARGIPMSAVVRRMGNPLFDGYLTRARKRLGWKIIHDHEGARQLPRVIAGGHAVPMLADQGVKGLASVFVPFFGRPARTPKGPALFAMRLKAPLVLTVWPREPDGKYRLYAEPVPVANTGDRERDIEATVAAYTRQLEAWVRKYPDQYLWQHRRWRRQQDGTFAY